jgi:hypothetical protein
VDLAIAVLEYLGLASVDQNDGALFVADVEGFVILIQNENGCTHRTPWALPHNSTPLF